LKRLVIIAFAGSLWAVLSLAGAAPIEWESYTYSNDCNGVEVAGNKILAASTGGLLEFNQDDKAFVKYTNADGLLECPAMAVAVDAGGNWWIVHATRGVTVRSAGDRYRVFTKYEGIPGESLRCAATTGDTVIVGTDDGIWSVDTKGDPFGSDLSFSLYLQGKCVNGIAIADTAVWYGTMRGLYGARKASPSETTYHYGLADGLPSNTVTSILDHNGLWIGTDSGIAYLKDSIWIEESSGLPSRDVRDLTLHRDTLWAATAGGAAFFDGTNWHTMNNGLLSSKLSSLAGDPSSVLWCGSIGGCISEYNGSWISYKSPGLLSNELEGVTVDQGGDVWVAYAQGGLGVTRIEDGTYSHFTKDTLADLQRAAKDLLFDKDGGLWIATWGGGAIERTPGGEWHVYTDTNNYLPNGYASAIDVDPLGNKWIASYFVGGKYGVTAVSRDNAQIELYDQSPLLVITDIAIDSSGNKWFASIESGVHELSDNGTPFDQSDDSWTSYQEPELPSDETRAVNVDKDGDVWVSTTGGTVRIRDGMIIARYEAGPGGPASSVMYQMAPEWDGGMWFEHEYGMTRRSPDGSWKNYTSADGLVSDKITYNKSCLFFDQETGDLLVGTGGGLSRARTGLVPHAALDSVVVYPNPFVPANGHRRISFANVPDGSTVRIYTMAGELVIEIDRVVASFAYWDGKNTSGKDVSSGIYLFAIGEKKTGIIAVIR
jgi:ligand-binding sensor domain-containing protein